MVTAEETAKPQATARQTGPQEPPIEVQIAALAHSLWEERGCPVGSPEEDWYRAEEILRTGKPLTRTAGS